MASKAPVWGIDVGQCSLKALKLQQVGEQVEILASDVVEHDTMLAQADAEATAMISKAIQTFAQRNDIKGCKIAIAVPGQQTLTRFTKMPPVEAKKIPDMVQYEASQQIPFDMDEVVWDYQVFQDKDSPDVEVGIFAIRRELIRNYVAYFTEQGVEPMLVQTSPMASYNAAKYEGVQPEGKAVVLLDMGALATDLIVMEGNRIWARPVPIGGNKFTEALMSAFKIPFAKAEKLKRAAATSKYARQVFAAMRPIFADLVAEVQRSVGYYTSTHREAHVTRVIGMGNAFKLAGLQKFLQQNLQMEVERLAGFKKLALGAAEASPAFTENIASFSVTYGLGLQALDLAGVQSNLLPLEVRRTLLWRKKRSWFAASAACLAVGAAALWVGNVLAGTEVRRALGEGNPPAAPRSVEEAEKILSSPSDAPAGERAKRVVDSANKLKQSLDEVDRGKKGDQDLFKKMAKLTENNVFVPRILDVIHRSLAEVLQPELKEVQTSADYAQVAKQIPRNQRREVWIDRFEMLYDSKDPARLFQQTTPDKPQTKAGWGLRITGTITGSGAATWLEETVKPMLTKLGREPNRGIYIDQIEMGKVAKKTDAGSSTVGSAPPEPSPGSESAGGRGGRGRIGTGSGEPTGSEEPGASGRGSRGGGTEQPTAPTGTPSPTGDEITQIRNSIGKKDFLTGENTTDDQRFILFVIVRKGDTPANMIPDEFKPKKPEPAKPGAAAAAGKQPPKTPGG